MKNVDQIMFYSRDIMVYGTGIVCISNMLYKRNNV